MHSQFDMRDGHIRCEPVRFGVPGAEVELVALRPAQRAARLPARSRWTPVSEAMGGGIRGFSSSRSIALRKNGKGAVVPIAVTAPTRSRGSACRQGAQAIA
jgi:hypothetical protein